MGTLFSFLHADAAYFRNHGFIAWLSCIYLICLQAIFAVMSVSPHERLSEMVLARAIAKHYEVSKLIPLGIGMSAVEQLAGKMAFGLRKTVSRFRRRWKESPDAAKLKGLTHLKQRLKEMNIEMSADSSASGHADSMDSAADQVEELGNALAGPDHDSKPAKNGIDWVAMAAKMQAHKKSAMPEAEVPAPLDDVQPPVRMAAVKAAPIATPCRNKLPEFVLTALEEVQAPAPFATVTSDDVEPTGNPAVKKAGDKKKNKKGKKNQKKGKGKVVIAGPEEEEGLALLPQQAPSDLAAGHETAPAAAGAAAPAADHAVGYVAGDFNRKRLEFIKNFREESNVNFKKANEAWMRSDERADLLKTVPLSELKKRRFA